MEARSQKPSLRSCLGSRCQSLATLIRKSRYTRLPSSPSICRLARDPTSLSLAPLAPMTIAFWLARSTYMMACTSIRSSLPGRGAISSTTTAIECGSSSLTPSRIDSLISSATSCCSGSSVSSPSGYSGRPGGRWLISTLVSTSSWDPVTADTGTMSAQPASSATAASWAATCSLVALSVLVTIATTGVLACAWPDNSAARYLSPGPMRSVAGTQNPITSTSVSVERTRLSKRSPSRVLGRCSPGVSMMISSASSVLTMPLITRRVVCGRLLVIATLVPTSAFISVDLPTLGRPAKQANPAANPCSCRSCAGVASTQAILPYRAPQVISGSCRSEQQRRPGVAVKSPHQQQRRPDHDYRQTSPARRCCCGPAINDNVGPALLGGSGVTGGLSGGPRRRSSR